MNSSRRGIVSSPCYRLSALLTHTGMDEFRLAIKGVQVYHIYEHKRELGISFITFTDIQRSWLSHHISGHKREFIISFITFTNIQESWLSHSSYFWTYKGSGYLIYSPTLSHPSLYNFWSKWWRMFWIWKMLEMWKFLPACLCMPVNVIKWGNL